MDLTGGISWWQKNGEVGLGFQIERHEKGNPVTSDGSDRLLLEIWLLEKISSWSVPPFKLAGIFLIKIFNSIKLQKKYFVVYFQYLFLLGGEIFCCYFHNHLFFFPPFYFLLGNDFISMDQTIPFYGSNSSVVFISCF
jgi:hypothetical protein